MSSLPKKGSERLEGRTGYGIWFSDVSGFVWNLNYTNAAVSLNSLSGGGLTRCVKDTVPE
jgi:hypothetical protein